LADDRRETNILHYTWNEGISLHQCVFNEEPIEIVDIFSDPLIQKTRFLITGTQGDNFVVLSLNFDDLHEKTCQGFEIADTASSDYETWEPSDSRGDLCLLGRKTAYVRRKQDKECLNPPTFTGQTKHIIENCSCTEENYECDYCYIRNDFNECVLDTETCPDYDPYTPPPICVEVWYRSQGYRRVPGDTCDHVIGVDHTPVEEKCSEDHTIHIPVANSDFLAIAIIIALPTCGSIAFVASILYYCSGKNQRVRGCMTMCLSEDMLPAYTYNPVPFSFSDDLQDDASMITTSESKSSDLEI